LLLQFGKLELSFVVPRLLVQMSKSLKIKPI